MNPVRLFGLFQVSVDLDFKGDAMSDKAWYSSLDALLERMSNRAKAITAICVCVGIIGSGLALHFPKYALAADLDRLAATVAILANVQTETLIAQKEAEIRSIIRAHHGEPPVEAQLTIKSLQSDIDRLKGE